MCLSIVLIQILLCLQPPLVQAIFSGDPEEIRMLIHKTEDVNALVGDAMVLPAQALLTFLYYGPLWYLVRSLGCCSEFSF